MSFPRRQYKAAPHTSQGSRLLFSQQVAIEGYYLQEAGRLVLFWSQVNGQDAGGTLMVIVLKHLANLSHVEHL
jgi:hypothetical protein